MVTNPGGHSSQPRPDNAIYELAHALIELEQHKFPFELNNVTRAYYEHLVSVESGQRAADIKAMLRTPPDESAIAGLSKDPIDNSRLHTTCVATRLSGGHANNALPGRAEAVVNCRILPDESPADVQRMLVVRRRASLAQILHSGFEQGFTVADDGFQIFQKFLS